ncbi:tRNA (guanosine(37)-N1)-methyltransferase TrmD [Halioxenophilus sp. WMMB6]|uniref:tRNA (guanosine(37)-N1)-methyltransferase TrmD n=1 Tax=Halioxenophilus sp. WMMB6 TaxID=3073815 RepID=UPI00295E9CEF|nr:tRNA (guanosine(37)-N1)-methyltransferase TrmD [Halioxenophilus sp. WMMB6]
MRIAIVTLFPEMFSAVTECGVTGRAVKQGLLSVRCWSPRDFARDKHRTVDDRPYGGGPGMLMMMQPLEEALFAAKAWAEESEQAGAVKAPVIYLSPQGQPLQQALVAELAQSPNLVLLCGRYEGIDERFIRKYVDSELSIGDYVLSGGELAAMVVLDTVIRLLPGALGHAQSAEQDSFSDGLLDCPHYTRPEVYKGEAVPAVLLSGNHERIRRWRLQQALGRTWQRRPELLANKALSAEQETLLREYLEPAPKSETSGPEGDC